MSGPISKTSRHSPTPMRYIRIISYGRGTLPQLIEKMFVKAIVDMLNGNAEEVYCGVAVLYFQILMEESSRAPFCVDRESLIKIASQTIRENEEQLKSIKKCGGQSSENGLWDEIRRYKKLFISKFGIII